MVLNKLEQKLTRDVVINLWPEGKPLDEEMIAFVVSVLVNWIKYRTSIRSMMRVQEKLSKDIAGVETEKDPEGDEVQN